MTKLSDDEMREAWRQTVSKHRGKKVRAADIWLSRKRSQNYVWWIQHGNRVIDQCNVWLEEMGERYADDD